LIIEPKEESEDEDIDTGLSQNLKKFDRAEQFESKLSNYEVAESKPTQG